MTKVKAGNSKRQKSSDDDEPLDVDIDDDDDRKIVNIAFQIVPCCGFDCIPSDFGCQMMVETMKARGK